MTEAGVPSHVSRFASRVSWPKWAVYLGVSWTWCIGMFLPALLWRDFGPWSFVVFALPNIVGAALLGVVMRGGAPEASRVFLERHRWACFAFSLVTVAFQVFFAAWVARVMGAGGGWASAAAEGRGGGEVGSGGGDNEVWHLGWVLCAAAALGFGGRRWAFTAAAAVWVVSLGVIALTVLRERDAGLLPEVAGVDFVLPLNHLWPLAMVCVLGFMLCPFLDRTFHRARIETGRQSGRAFAMGFGLFFAVMIVGTLLTAPVLIWMTSPSGSLGGVATGRLLIALFAAHTLPQLVFTCWVHGAEAKGPVEKLVLVAVALLVGYATVQWSGDRLVRAYGWTSETRQWANPLYGGEVVYRVFMAAYGLVFPAYVAIVSWPVKLGGAEVRPGRVGVFAVVVLAAAWFYWVGFVERKTWWVAVGVGMVVVGKLVGRVVEWRTTVRGRELGA